MKTFIAKYRTKKATSTPTSSQKGAATMLRHGVVAGLVGCAFSTFAFGCSKTERESRGSNRPQAGLSTTVTLPHSAPSASTTSYTLNIKSSAEQVLLAWNAALDRRDVDGLKSLYNPEVLYYGVRKTAEQVLQAKRDAFAQNSQYRQRLDNVHIAPGADSVSVTFRKHSGAELRSSVKARIILKAQGDRLTIAEETDAATDELLRKREPKDCLDAALTIAGRQTVIARDRERVARDFPDIHQSAVIYESTEDTVDANMGYFHPGRFEGHWGITVEDGELRIVDNWTSEPLLLSESDKTSVRRICRRKARDASTGE
jgi:hypothetical protein